MLRIILIVFLVLLLIGVFPIWPHSMSWGYLPSGGIGTLLVILVVVMLVA